MHAFIYYARHRDTQGARARMITHTHTPGISAHASNQSPRTNAQSQYARTHTHSPTDSPTQSPRNTHTTCSTIATLQTSYADTQTHTHTHARAQHTHTYTPAQTHIVTDRRNMFTRDTRTHHTRHTNTCVHPVALTGVDGHTHIRTKATCLGLPEE